MDDERIRWGAVVLVGLAAAMIAGCGAGSSFGSEGDTDTGLGLEDGSKPGGLYGTVAFACNPAHTSMEEGVCPSSYFCCSSDPSTQAGQLPDFDGDDVATGLPYFAGNNNNLGSRGNCVHRESVREELSLTAGLAAGCPIPCNPTWSTDDVEATCGVGTSCCQAADLEPTDCIQDDPDDPQSWRPVRGSDILEGRTNWASIRHATHQDPGGVACEQFATETIDLDDPGFSACVQALTVADQQGYCVDSDAGCPRNEALDACEQISMGLIPPPS